MAVVGSQASGPAGPLRGSRSPDRIPAARYYDREFYDARGRAALDAHLADGVPAGGDPRPGRRRRVRDPRPVGDGAAHRGGVRAFQNACRHRGVKLVDGRDRCESGFTCPFHGWCYGTDGKNTAVTRKRTFSEHNLQPGDLDLRPVRCETWGGCAWINLDDDALPLRESIEPAATILDAWKVESLRAEWWYACPAPGELEAGAGGVRRAVPRARDPPAAAHPGPHGGAGQGVRPPHRGSTPSCTTSA